MRPASKVVGHIALAALKRADAHPPTRGAHVFRYTAACQLLRHEIDPLVCPRCRGVMRVVSFITQPRLIRRILDHLAGCSAQNRAPPEAAGAVRSSS